MKRIVIVTTGGTIAMRADGAAGGAVPALAGADFLAALPPGLADLQTEEFSNLPSAHFTLEALWNLSRRVDALVKNHAVDGVVVTHGTDTLEESAYLCDLTIDSQKPVVFTGAMRTASEVGSDGLANLAASVTVAASDDARDLGTLVVFNDAIHSARDVTKMHTTALDSFQSPEFGPMGRLDYGGVHISRRPARREFIPASKIETQVYLLKLAVGMNESMLEYLSERLARGIILEALGGGRVPPWWLPAIERAISQGVPVVVASRAGSGRTVDRYAYAGAHDDLARLGCWFAHGLNGQKARIRLMVALGAGNARRYFE